MCVCCVISSFCPQHFGWTPKQHEIIVFVCVWVDLCVCMYAWCVLMYLSVCLCECPCVSITVLCLCVGAHIRVFVSLCVSMCACVCMCMCVCVCVCVKARGSPLHPWLWILRVNPFLPAPTPGSNSMKKPGQPAPCPEHITHQCTGDSAALKHV